MTPRDTPAASDLSPGAESWATTATGQPIAVRRRRPPRCRESNPWTASKFTTRSQEAIAPRSRRAAAAGTPRSRPSHLLAALLGASRRASPHPLLEAVGVPPGAVEAGVRAELAKLPAATGSSVAAPSYSRAAIQVFSTADRHRRGDEGRLHLHRAPAASPSRPSTRPRRPC